MVASTRRLRWVGGITLAIVALLAPFVVNNYYVYILSLIGIHIIIAVGLNLLTGYTGQISFGHAGFSGIGGYVSVLLVQRSQWSFWLACPAGAVAAGLTGMLVGLPALRIGGHYLALVTFAFGRIMFLAFLQWRDLTGGYEGLTVARPRLGPMAMDSEVHLYYLVMPVMVLLVIGARNLVASRVGRAFIAIRDSAVAGQSVGINVATYKTMAFTVSAFYAGLAGALFPLLTSFISPEMFGMFESALYLFMVILGGLGTLGGPILGATIMTILPEALRAFKDYQELMYGLIFVLLLIFMPRGIYGALEGRFAHWREAMAVPFSAVREGKQ